MCSVASCAALTTALASAGISARFAGPRREELAQMLLKEVRAMEKKLNALDSPWG